MKKLFTRKNFIDINVYLLGIILDSFSVFIILQAGLGASPFGAFSANLIIILPISIGIASVIYDFINIAVASLLTKQKMQLHNLLYALVYAAFFELWYLIIPSFSGLHIVFAILIFIVGVCFADLAKSILNLLKFPKEPSILVIYAINKRFNINLNWASKIRSLAVIFFAFIFGIIMGNPLSNLGFGTLISLVAFGFFLKLVDPTVKKIYKKIIKDNSLKQT